MNQVSQDVSKTSKYFIFIAIMFVAVLMVSNTITVKLIQIGPFIFTGAIFIFPISYIFGDVLTEVYGYRASRKIIWSGFVALIFMTFCYWLIQILPAPAFWQNQDAYNVILGTVPRIVFASIIAYFAGEFVNSIVLSKMKVLTNGKKLWMRTIGSTVAGQGVDSLIFGIIAFVGTIPYPSLALLIVSGYFAKVAYEVLLTPVTYLIVNKLKKAERIDVYDTGIRYNPFLLKE